MTPRERIKELTDEIAKVANENDFKILLVTSYPNMPRMRETTPRKLIFKPLKKGFL